VAGVIKMVKAMEHGTLPSTLHVDEPSHHVDWSSGSVSLLTEARPWEPGSEPRRAGVSSFGVSGTNAHVILEEPPSSGSAPTGEEEAEAGSGVEVGVGSEAGSGVQVGVGSEAGSGVERVPVMADGVTTVPWVLSARGAAALRGQAERLGEFLEGTSVQAGDVAVSLAGRHSLPDRAVLVGAGVEQLESAGRVLAEGGSAPGLVVGRTGTGTGGPVFVFAGQGSQWVGMGAALLDESPVFAGWLRDCDQALSNFVDWSVEGVLRGAEGAPGLDRVDVVQPVLFAVMVSLAGLWRACGVQPAAVVGHSQGEIAAAFVAGGLSLEDAARVVAVRSRALLQVAGKGGMLSVALSEQDVAERLKAWDGRIGIAAVNGPSSVVLSGEPTALEGMLEQCLADDVRARLIGVDYAAHSEQVELVRQELLDGCVVEPRSGEVPFYSTVTGEPLDTATLHADYWYRNLRETVGFEAATRRLLADGHRAFVEVSPHPVLTLSVQETAEEVLSSPEEAVVAGSLRRDEGGIERFMLSLGEVWVAGIGVDWERLLDGHSFQRIGLPTYAFQRERFWLSGGGAGDVASVGLSAAGHPLLGAVVAVADGAGWIFTGRISLEEHPWLADHAVLDTALLPGTAMLELALRAGEHAGAPVVQELVLEAPLVFTPDSAVQVQVVVHSPQPDGARDVAIYSRPDEARADGED
jgi:polyketide synthase 12